MSCQNNTLLTYLSFALSCSQREPLRKFYESLSQQIPPSEMAEFCFHFTPQKRGKENDSAANNIEANNLIIAAQQSQGSAGYWFPK
ncbi:hypothetical protein Nepgr_000912 [Nepenthes gracilis]|uniref:Uncharacterized protein n=1 Tax=Nepenthes gracilis TaxID=150966 RepID=A0AAD3RX81_NEPGR|nr:hypothetical protein Nepgr_000912 [Nepenthes gracilis]